jgi:hypothetical protein
MKGVTKIPEQHLHDFHRRRLPPDSARLWIAATDQRQFTYINQATIKVFAENGEPPERANAFMSVLGIGHVAFGLSCWTDTKPVSSLRRVHETFSNAVIPIWPYRMPVQWPPSKSFAHQGLDQLAAGLGGPSDFASTEKG